MRNNSGFSLQHSPGTTPVDRVRISTTIAFGVLLVIVGSALPAHARDAESGEAISELLWQAANLVLLVGVLFAVARKPVSAYFAERREQIAGDIKTADQLLADSRTQFAQWQGKLAEMEQEIEGIRKETRRRAEGERDQIIATAQREAQTRDSGQSSMFGGGLDGDGADSSGVEMSGIPLTAPDVSDQEKADWERELLGMALSHDPLRNLGAIDTGGALNSLDQLDKEMSGQSINMLGYISTVTERTTREGKRFFIVNLEVLGGFLEVMVWPDTLQRTAEVWQDGRLVLVAGRLRLRGDQMSLACDGALE